MRSLLFFAKKYLSSIAVFAIEDRSFLQSTSKHVFHMLRCAFAIEVRSLVERCFFVLAGESSLRCAQLVSGASHTTREPNY